MASILELFEEPKPHAIRQSSSLGTNAYVAASGINAYGKQATFDIFVRVSGDQATFDIPARTDPTQGLRVTIPRQSLPTEASNGVTVHITQNGGLPGSFAYNATTKVITGNARGSSILSAFRTTIIADAAFSAADLAYFGGESGASTTGAVTTVTTGGTPDALDDSQGLRVTLARSSLAAALSNGVSVEIEQGAASAATFSTTSRNVEIDATAAADLDDLKTLIDAETGLSSSYFGGETGTGLPFLENKATFTATRDPRGVYRIVSGSQLYAHPGTAAPSSDSGVRIIAPHVVQHGRLAPGERLWIKRVGTSNVRGSVELWLA